jgi:signal peptidase I
VLLLVILMNRARLDKQPRPTLRLPGLLQYIARSLLVIPGLFIFINLTTVRFVVDGVSMEPALQTGQYLLVSRVHYLFAAPQRGDLAVFHYPNDPQRDYIKRIVGLPGEQVELRNQQVFIDGQPLPEPYLNRPCSPGLCSDGVWQLDANSYFMMGDNRNRSSDSRGFGAVARNYLVGKAVLLYWPPLDMKHIQ